jgi:hypothetical protein
VRPQPEWRFNNPANAIVYRLSEAISVTIFLQIRPLLPEIVAFIAQCGFRPELLQREEFI